MTEPAARTVDVVVIGGGPAGENAAARTAAAGLQTVLVERELLGGECSYWACMPSKALLRPVDAVSAARRVAGAAQAVSGAIAPAEVFRRRDGFASDWDDTGQVEWAQGEGIETVRGHARLTGQREVTVDGEHLQRLTARHAVVVATGSVPAEPPIPGLADVPHWGSREATSASRVPESLIVLGGGVVGLEMAQAYAGLGSSVCVLGGGELLARAEPIAGELVGASLRRQGVDVRTGAQAVSVSRADGVVRVELGDGSSAEGSELLVATGRRPASHDLGVETVGLEPGRALEVDDTGLVQGLAGTWLYAVGDVNGRAPLTHQGKYQARVVGTVIAARARGQLGEPADWSAYSLTADAVAVPQVVFTDPQVASVGLTAAEAEDRGVRTRVVDLDIAVAGASLLADEYEGKARFVVDETRQVLVGVTFVGQDVAELLHSATVAVVGEVPLARLWHAVPSYPTISEVWLRFLESYGL